jgi:amino acid transporter
MNIRQENKEDHLRQYINPEMIEKAPEGFTEKVMTRIQIETSQLKIRKKTFARSKVPVISAVFTMILMIAAIFLPSSGSDHFILPGLKLIKNIDLPAIKIIFDSLFNLNVPGWLPYLFICILILTIFDRGLNGLFHREK